MKKLKVMILNFLNKCLLFCLLAFGLLASKEATAGYTEYAADQIFNGQQLMLPLNITGYLTGYNQFLPQDSDEIVFQVLNPMPVTYNVNIYSVSNPDAKINLVISEIDKKTGFSSGKLPVVVDSKGINGLLTASYTFSNKFKYIFTITIDPLFNENDCKYYYGEQSRYKIEINPDQRLKSKVTFIGNANDETIRITPAEITYDPESTYSEFPTVTRDGYKLLSWYTDDTYGMEITNGMNVCIGYDKFYARWEMIKQLRIKFDGNGGTSDAIMEDVVIKNDESKLLPKNLFVREKYKFIGWSHSKDATVVEYEDQGKYDVANLTKNEEKTLYAIWENNPVIVEFVGNGGEGIMDSQEIQYNERAPLKQNEFEREGFTFKGWALASASTTVDFQDQSFCTGKELVGGAEEDRVTLYAVWEQTTSDEEIIEGSANISFDSNGGEGKMIVQIFPLKETAQISKNIFTKDCYKFEGWSLTKNGEIRYKDQEEIEGTKIPNGGVITLYAVWKKVAVRISFNPNGGSGRMDDQVVGLDEEVNLTANSYTREGYVFEGWALSQDGSKLYEDNESCSRMDLSKDDKITLYAVWSEKSIEIVFNGNGGIADTEMPNQTIKYSEKVKLGKNTYKKEGFVFKGWAKIENSTNIDYEDGAELSGKSLIDENQVKQITLYAQWDRVGPIDYVEIKFDGNGAKGSMPNTIIKGRETLPQNYFLRDEDEYVFLGWSKDPNAKAAEFNAGDYVNYSDLSLTGEVTLYAIWKHLFLKVIFNANGGEGEMDDLKLFEDDAVTIEKNKFVKKGHKFKGWAISADSTEIKYLGKDIIRKEDWEGTEVLTLYAVWGKKGFKLILANLN